MVNGQMWVAFFPCGEYRHLAIKSDKLLQLHKKICPGCDGRLGKLYANDAFTGITTRDHLKSENHVMRRDASGALFRAHYANSWEGRKPVQLPDDGPGDEIFAPQKNVWRIL